MTAENDTLPAASPDDSATAKFDDDSELETSQIAEYLSQLSQPGQVPFDAAEVDFQSNGWLERVIDVQAWLCLDQPLDKKDAVTAATLLFEQLTPDPPHACFTPTEGGVAKLSSLGRQHLETWLSRAVAHRESFQEMLDDDRSPKDASENWRLLWEEAGSGSRHPVAINAKVVTWRTKEFRDFAEEGILDLNPSYQRDVVWSNTESQMLIESILRGIPLPSVILTQVEGERRHQIVDGKQRLTAILRFIGRHPEGRLNAEQLEGGLPLFEKKFRAFASKNNLKPRDIAAKFFPFKLGKFKPNDPLYALSGKYYDEIVKETIRIGDQKVTVKEIFESITSDYVIPVIIYYRTRIQDIHIVFSLYNKQGKKLNAEELRNAVFHHLELMLLLLVLSGDRPVRLAPYLPVDVRERIEEVGNMLTSLGFGTARFKRTKVLSWASAIFLHPPRRSSSGAGAFSTPSTASHIDSMLEAVDDKPENHTHPLFQRNNLVTLARDLLAAITTHREAAEAWHPRFRRKADKETLASKWEELPLVASLVATVVLASMGRHELLIERLPEVRAFTAEHRAPAKTQNKTQWQYIARFVTGLLGHLGVDMDEADKALEDRYKYSCLKVLRSLAEAVA
jgi:hypothetical protein